MNRHLGRYRQSLRILIVSDNEELRRSLAGVLGMAEVCVTPEPVDARNRVQAALREERPFALVVLDAAQPEEILAQAFPAGTDSSNHERWGGVTRYLLCSDEGVAPKSLASRINHCFRTPMASTELSRYVERLLVWEGGMNVSLGDRAPGPEPEAGGVRLGSRAGVLPAAGVAVCSAEQQSIRRISLGK